MSEKEFMGQVVQLAALYRWRVYHTFDSRRSAEGFPDLVLCRPPRVIFAELKSEHGELSHAQFFWSTDLRASGQAIYLWRPSDWNFIKQVLE